MQLLLTIQKTVHLSEVKPSLRVRGGCLVSRTVRRERARMGRKGSGGGGGGGGGRVR